jgi:hypothetical protein
VGQASEADRSRLEPALTAYASAASPMIALLGGSPLIA